MIWIFAVFLVFVAGGFYMLRTERRATASAKKIARQRRARQRY